MDRDLIKALRCLASQDENGDCYMEHHNFMHSNEPGIYCGSYPIDGRIKCPYYQNKYGVCFEDGECEEWLNEVTDILEKRFDKLEERYTIEQILDAITQADEEIIEAIRYKDREMLEDVLKDYL